MRQKNLAFLPVFVLMLFATTGRPFAIFKANPPSLPTIPTWPAKSRRPPWRFVTPTLSPTPTALPEPTPTPRPIAQGSQTYTAFGGSGLEGPRMRKFIINPHDPRAGELQTMRVYIKSANVVQEVRVLLQTDNENTTYQFSLVEGSYMDGWWEGSWITKDTHNVNYVATFEAVNNTGLSRTDLTIR